MADPAQNAATWEDTRVWKGRAVVAEAERDRYRRALQEIAGVALPPIPDWEFYGVAEDRERSMRSAALKALLEDSARG